MVKAITLMKLKEVFDNKGTEGLEEVELGIKCYYSRINLAEFVRKTLLNENKEYLQLLLKIIGENSTTKKTILPAMECGFSFIEKVISNLGEKERNIFVEFLGINPAEDIKSQLITRGFKDKPLAARNKEEMQALIDRNAKIEAEREAAEQKRQKKQKAEAQEKKKEKAQAKLEKETRQADKEVTKAGGKLFKDIGVGAVLFASHVALGYGAIYTAVVVLGAAVEVAGALMVAKTARDIYKFVPLVLRRNKVGKQITR